MADAEFLIAGGGIAGLAAALGLARIGRPAFVVERAPNFETAGAGLQLGPNAVRALQWLGAWDAVEPATVAPPAIVVHDGLSGRILQRIALGRRFEARFGAPYRVAGRADLLNGLLAVARAAPGIVLRCNHEIVSWAERERHVDIAFGTAGTLRARALLGADGIRSRVREILLGDGSPIFRGHAYARALMPVDQVAAADAEAVCLWLCPRGHVVHYPVDGGRQLNIVAAYDCPMFLAGWSEAIEPRALLAHFESATDALQGVLSAPTAWRQWAAMDRLPARAWSRGAIALLGDAAHPALPSLAQGAAMALEDAVALGHAVAGEPDVARAFKLFVDRRLARTSMVQRHALRLARIYHAGGAVRLARDGLLRVLPPERFIDRLAWLYDGP